jgi:hypothetical protein
MPKLNILTKLNSNDSLIGNLAVNFIKENTVNVDEETLGQDVTVTSSSYQDIGLGANNIKGWYVFAFNKSTINTIDINVESSGNSGAKYASIPPGESIFIFIPIGVGIQAKTSNGEAKMHFLRFIKS